MKKSLLLILSAFVSVPMFASVDAEAISGVTINRLSPDGKSWCSEIYGDVSFHDGVNDKDYLFRARNEMDYSVGSGYCISNTGILVGGVNMQDASWCKDGVWTSLQSSITSKNGTRAAFSITPDGKRICGMVAPTGASGYDGLNGIPCYWEQQADGTYGDAIILPYPAKDFTGREPQYVIANGISDDGKTIVGNVHDFSGGYNYPILFKQNDKGEWSYEILHPELLNPSDVKFPANALPEVKQPEAEDFLSAEGKAAYDAAYALFMETYDWSLYPYAEDFLTPEERAAYNAAMAQYEIDYAAWSEQFDEINGKIDEMIAAGAVFYTFNSVFISADGKYVATTSETLVENNDPWAWTPYTAIYTPALFNLETGNYEFFKSEDGMIVTYAGNDGAVLATTNNVVLNGKAYIKPADGTKFITLEEYIAGVDAELADWMTENMTHTCMVDAGYDENDEYVEVYDKVLTSGCPTSTPDLTTFATWTETYMWQEAIEDLTYSFPEYYSYILTPGSKTDAIDAALAGEAFEVSVVGNTIVISGEAASVAVYDLNGRMVLNVANPASVVDTNLASGVYVVKAVAVNGDTVTVKAAF